MHVFQKFRPLFAESMNLPALRALARRTTGDEVWAQECDAHVTFAPHTTEDLDCIAESISTQIMSEPLGIAFVGEDGVLEAHRKDEVNAPVLATYKKCYPNPPYPFGRGIFGKLARKMDFAWGKEYSFGDLTSAAFDGDLLLFIRHSGPGYRDGYFTGLLIQSKYSRTDLARYHIR